MQPLKREVEAVAQLLVAGAESPEDLAKQVIVALDNARAERVTYGVVLRFGKTSPFFQGFGMFSTKNQALKALEKHPAVGQASGMAVVPFLNDVGMEQLFASVDAKPEARGDFIQVQKDAADFRAGRKVSR